MTNEKEPLFVNDQVVAEIQKQMDEFIELEKSKASNFDSEEVEKSHQDDVPAEESPKIEEIKDDINIEESNNEEVDLYKSAEEKAFIEGAIEQMCNMKAEEFKLIGVEATGKRIWQCVSSKYRRGFPGFHKITNDILSLKSTVYMNWLLIESQKGNINFD